MRADSPFEPSICHHNLERRRSRWIGITSAVTGSSPAGINSSSPHCFARVHIPDLTRHTDQRVWDLGDCAARNRPYEILLIEGTDRMIFRWSDAALFVDTWSDLELPAPIRQAWAPGWTRHQNCNLQGLTRHRSVSES